MAGNPPADRSGPKARDAAEICKEEWFRDDLTGLTSSGVPLCVPGSTLKPRIANASEMGIYQEAAKEANASRRPGAQPASRLCLQERHRPHNDRRGLHAINFHALPRKSLFSFRI